MCGDSHVVVWHDWKSEDDGENQRQVRPQILQTESKHLCSLHMALISYDNYDNSSTTEEECGIWDSLCEANN